MDFYRIKERLTKNDGVEIYPDFRVIRSNDLMLRGRAFYAIWDEARQLWSQDEYDVQRLVDEDLAAYAEKRGEGVSGTVSVKYMSDFSSNTWLAFRNYLGHLSDSSHQLDENLVFSNTEVKKTDYVSRKLPYPLTEGDHSSYDELMDVLYSPEERQKLEWAIGAIISGDSKHIQKFMVLYGPGGTGKSTFLNIVQKLFVGYFTTFEAKALVGNNNAFSTEAFRLNPLVAIQHDGDLSKIEDNTKLNSIISHEDMLINEKYKPAYTSRSNAFLFMGSNKPVKITDAKSGIIRRLIDVHPTGNKIPPRKYQALYSQVDFELGAIAYHCLEVYRENGKDAYSAYRPIDMMLQTDVFYNYIEANFDLFTKQDGVTLKQAYALYKQYCDESGVEYRLPQYKMREELKNYFKKFDEKAEVNGTKVYSWYSEFEASHFKSLVTKDEPKVFSLVMDDTDSLFDREMAEQPAQYANKDETPIKKWSDVKTTLAHIDTTKLHYVKPGLNHIIIDFDLTDAEGNKSIERNLEAASVWPSTYAEYSKSGHGVHLSYYYDGDVTKLSRIYDSGIEIKIFTGDSSLRRKLSKCNNIPIATISSGLPLREDKKVINVEMVKSEKSLREQIERNLRKEIHSGTKSSVDFIKKILDDAYDSGLPYDVTDMRNKILSFANNSTNQAIAAIKTVQTMKFQSAEVEPESHISECQCDECKKLTDDRVVIFDCEVFPNLLIVCWKYENSDEIVKMINPSAADIEQLVTLKLTGFNNRGYDSHILYAAMLGYSNEQIYQVSRKIIDNVPGSKFREAYNMGYADVLDYSSKKQTLKKWEIELGLRHLESGLDWSEPAPKDKWEQLVEYCCNDVLATEAVFHATEADFTARKILSELSGLPVIASTQQHTGRIIFGNDRNPQKKFNYPDLAEEFPGYKFEFGKASYLGEDPGNGGYVWAKPGMYRNVVLLDVSSMHPQSIEEMNLFGEYTQKFSDLKAARVAIKRGNFDEARGMLDGALAPYLTDTSNAEKLAYALKLVINSIYGYTAARFDNLFRDPRNLENIVAKRGALFLIELKQACLERGYEALHCKTDSIKIANSTPEIIQFVIDFGAKYGYQFEVEAIYDRLCLVNEAVYVARKKPEDIKENDPHRGWTATGAQFAVSYVFKKLFTHESIEFRDLCEAKSVKKGAMYIDFSGEEDAPMALDKDQRHFVGKVGLFCPVKEGRGGGELLRVVEDKAYAVTGTKGWRWLEAEMIKTLGREYDINLDYFNHLVDEAVTSIGEWGDVEAFTA